MGVARRSRALARGAVLALLVVAGTLLAPMLAAPSPAAAASGISITGSFYRQPFVIPQGGSAFGPSIYVMVSNQGAEAFNVRMLTAAITTDNAPEPGISVNLSRVSFSLQPGAQQRIDIRVDVAQSVPAGQYNISVTAESYQDTAEGISVSGSAAQTASLTVAGESATALVSTVGPSGQPVIAQVRLFRMVDGSGYEMASSNTGSLQAKVAPGTFSAEAYSLTTGDQLCEPATFDIAGGEFKTITLTARTVYFENDFVVNANYDSQTGELLNARTLATLTNVLEMMTNTEVRLVVTRNGDPLEEITVLGPLTLPVGQTGVPWNYIPAEGWKAGRYGFSYRLYVGGVFVAQTAEQTLEVGGKGGVSSWLWLIFLALGIVGAGGLGLVVRSILKNRKKGEGRPRKDKEKRRKEEKGKAERPAVVPEPVVTAQPPREAGPIAQPEPETQSEPARATKAVPAKPAQKPAVTPQPAPVQQFRPAQAARPVQGPKPVQAAQPVQQAKPVPAPRPAQAVQPARAPKPVPPAQPVRAQEPPMEQPARLATVSSLKARMASLGQDQRQGRDTDEDEGDDEAEAKAVTAEEPVQDSVEVTVVPDEAPPVEAAPPEAEAEAEPQPEPEADAVETVEAQVEEPAAVQETPAVYQAPMVETPARGKPGIVSSVTVTRNEPPKGAGKQAPPTAKPGDDEIVINWPPKAVQPPQRPAPAEPPAPPAAAEEPVTQDTETVEGPAVPEETAPVSEAAPVEDAALAVDVAAAEETVTAEEVATDGPETEAETAPPPPLMKSSFVEAAKLRMQAREHATVDGGGKDEG